jgi:hypothetical protein
MVARLLTNAGIEGSIRTAAVRCHSPFNLFPSLGYETSVDFSFYLNKDIAIFPCAKGSIGLISRYFSKRDADS